MRSCAIIHPLHLELETAQLKFMVSGCECSEIFPFHLKLET